MPDPVDVVRTDRPQRVIVVELDETVACAPEMTFCYVCAVTDDRASVLAESTAGVRTLHRATDPERFVAALHLFGIDPDDVLADATINISYRTLL